MKIKYINQQLEEAESALEKLSNIKAEIDFSVKDIPALEGLPEINKNIEDLKFNIIVLRKVFKTLEMESDYYE